jgi:SP family arabinose:H+ symporter-like MFS transporter
MNRAYVYAIAAAAAVSGLLFGFDTAVINGALVLLKEQFHLSDVQTEAAASALLVGCLIGSGGAGSLTDRFGRKRVLLAAATLFCLSSLATALPRNLWEFAVARVAAGLAIGAASVLAPMYIAEVAPPSTRGRLVTLNQMAIVTGILLAYFVNWMLADLGASAWRWMFAAAAVPSVVFFAALLPIPESPRWLMARGRVDEASRILARITGPKEAQRQMVEIRAGLAEESGSWSELLQPRLRKPLGLAIGLAILCQVTGINTVIYYGSILFREHAGSASASDAIGANVIIGAVNFAATLVAVGIIDRAGRRRLLLAGSAGMGAAMFLLGLAFRVSPPPTRLVLALVLVYIASFAVSLGAVVWVYIAELFPTRVRGRAMSVGTFFIWAACLLVTMTFLSLVRALSPSGAFWVYGGLCAVTFVFVWAYAPETKGRSLEEIQKAFTAPAPTPR